MIVKGKWKGKKRDFHFRNEGENMTDKKKIQRVYDEMR